MKNQEYYDFQKFIEGKIPDSLARDEEVPATPQEIGWWKQHQIRRAIHHMRYSIATPPEMHLLRTHGILTTPSARQRTKHST